MKNLQSLEQEVSAVLYSGTEVVLSIGTSLAEIRDRKLYKEAGYRSFEVYLNDKFRMKRARAYHLISAARVIEDLRSHFGGGDLPKNESVVRPLMKYQKAELIEIWGAVISISSEPRREDVIKVLDEWPVK